MPRNQVTIAELRTRVERLKNELYWEEHQYSDDSPVLEDKFSLDKYLNQVFDILDEYRL